MRILVTGGCGFIGSFVTERFYKEGHQVYVLDNLSTGSTQNLSFKPTFYELSVNDDGCEEIFKSGKFDIVVHLAAQVDVETSVLHPAEDANTNVMGLIKMLTLSQKYGVKKFIFASSAAVYGTRDDVPLAEQGDKLPLSPYGLNKLAGEEYCRVWSELYGLNTLAFRFSNVYGPKQGRSGEGGVISIFMQRCIEEQDITINGDGGQTRDFIYVEDIADAIYRSSSTDLSGVYNLSTNQETSLNELAAYLSEFKPLKSVKHGPARTGDIYRSVLDNSRIKRDLDWVPLYGVQEGLQKTYDWFANHHAERTEPKQKRKGIRERLRVRSGELAYAENALLFVVLLLLSVFPVHWVEDINIDLRLLYIIIIGIIYGARQTLIAIFLASGLYVYTMFGQGKEWLSILYDTEVLFTIAVYLLFGIMLGFTTDKRLQDLDMSKQQQAAQQERFSFLRNVLDEVSSSREELERRIINSKDSIGRLYQMSKKLESLEQEKVMSAAIHVIEDMLETDSVAIYSVSNSNYLRLRVYSNKEREWVNNIHLPDSPVLSNVVEEQQIWVNKQFDADMPMMVAPFVYEGNTIAVIAVYELPYEKMNAYIEHTFTIISKLFSDSLYRALKYSEAVRSVRYIEGTSVLLEDSFADLVKQKQETKQLHRVPYVLMLVKGSARKSKEIGQQIVTVLRETDSVGQLASGELMVLLSNTNDYESGPVRERIKRLGLQVEIITEQEWSAGGYVYA